MRPKIVKYNNKSNTDLRDVSGSVYADKVARKLKRVQNPNNIEIGNTETRGLPDTVLYHHDVGESFILPEVLVSEEA